MKLKSLIALLSSLSILSTGCLVNNSGSATSTTANASSSSSSGGGGGGTITNKAFNSSSWTQNGPCTTAGGNISIPSSMAVTLNMSGQSETESSAVTTTYTFADSSTCTCSIKANSTGSFGNETAGQWTGTTCTPSGGDATSHCGEYLVPGNGGTYDYYSASGNNSASLRLCNTANDCCTYQ